MAEGLTKGQKRFCERVIENGFNRTEAYLYAYGCSEETANTNANKLMKMPKVLEYIEALQEQALREACITPARLAKELGKIAFNPEEKTTDRLRAVELLQKQYGLQKQVFDVNERIITVDIIDEEE